MILHKSLLLLFGDTDKTLQLVKDHVRTTLNLPPIDKSKSVISTSPLDYHLFRQEIIAKYPTYTPPPLPVRESLVAEPVFTPTRELHTATTNYYDGSGGPVHIATPAPSPPPSPKLKKSIYQTDQTVPLLLPGNGEIPRSILEAGELYSDRMRITSATVQMWQEKDKFSGYVQGFWDHEDQGGEESEESSDEDANLAAEILERVEDTYVCPEAIMTDEQRESLPYLQGMVVALLQLLLANFTVSNMLPFKDLEEEPRPDTPEELETALIDATREKEIIGKSVTGILLLLLKWFRVSRKIPLFESNARCFEI